MVMDHKSGVMVTADGGFVVARPDKLVSSRFLEIEFFLRLDTDLVALSFTALHGSLIELVLPIFRPPTFKTSLRPIPTSLVPSVQNSYETPFSLLVVRLLSVTNVYRTLYWTMTYFVPNVKRGSRIWRN